MQFAFGELGLLPRDYYRMTRAEFILMCRGYRERQFREWEKTRFVGYQTYLNRPIKGRHQRMTKWMPLPTDRHSAPEVDVEEMKRLLAPKKSA